MAKDVALERVVEIESTWRRGPFPQRAAIAVARFVRKKPLGAFGAALVLVTAVLAVGAPLFERYGPEEKAVELNPNFRSGSLDPDELNPTRLAQLKSPSTDHFFGTDRAGRDIWSRTIHGARISLQIGVGAIVLSVLVGGIIGLVSAYFGSWVDLLFQRVIDALLAFPPLILLLLIVTVAEPSVRWSILALGFLGIATVSRIVRSAVLSVRQEPYVEAARLLGARDMRIMARHVLPNVAAPIIVVFTLGIGNFILAEATLAFLGLSVQEASWGKMIQDGRQFFQQSPWTSLFPGTFLTLTVLGFNLAGDALRDVLDPRLRVA